MASVDTEELGIENKAHEPTYTYEQGSERPPATPFIHDTTLCVSKCQSISDEMIRLRRGKIPMI